MVATIDVLKMFERLKGADLSAKATKEISDIIREAIRAETKKYKSETIKWVAASFITQIGVIVAALLL
ncbi:MAG: hypothetical protein HQK96_10180 [Nitrospirae bacterium]|nr:hypothetical protein [Nitrospirota bacterium]